MLLDFLRVEGSVVEVLLWFYGLLVDDVYVVVFVDLCLEGSNFSDNKLFEKTLARLNISMNYT